MTALCTSCKEIKVIHLRHLCSKCYYRHWRMKNPKRAAAIKKKWKQANPGKIREGARIHYAANKPRMRKQRREWYQENREQAKEYTQKWQRANPKQARANTLRQHRKLPTRFNQAKLGARKRGHAWRLPFYKWAELVRLPCHYCGETLSAYGCGLDRINNKHGYSDKNCVPCCGGCNIAKHSATYDDFISRTNRIARRHLEAQ